LLGPGAEPPECRRTRRAGRACETAGSDRAEPGAWLLNLAFSRSRQAMTSRKRSCLSRRISRESAPSRRQ
jgi:hypothetical protein